MHSGKNSKDKYDLFSRPKKEKIPILTSVGFVWVLCVFLDQENME